jgi:hypothetical protein
MRDQLPPITPLVTNRIPCQRNLPQSGGGVLAVPADNHTRLQALTFLRGIRVVKQPASFERMM